MELSKAVLISIVLFIVAFAAHGAAGKVNYYYSINLGCENNVLELRGGRVLAENGKPLKAGSLVQYIYAGRDGVANKPSGYKKVSGDDVLIKEGKIGDDVAWKSFSNRAGLFFDTVSGKVTAGPVVKLYARAWENGKKYGDSQIISLEANSFIMPLPEDVGLKSFYIKKVIE